MIPMLGGQRNISPNIQWSNTAQPSTVPILSFFGMNSPPQPVTFFNQENIPFPVPPALWNQNWNIHPQPQLIQAQCQVGRPILGRRSEPNHQTELQSSFCDSNKNLNTSVGEEADRGVKRARPHSPQETIVQNNIHTERKSLPPSLHHPVLGVNTSIPPPPIVNLPRSKDNEYVFNPIPQATCNPVELHVTNLDQSIDLREMKKLLMAAFREHVMVLHVSVFVQSDGSLAASVKVPSLQDAQYAISQLHRRKVGFKRIMIAYAHSTSPHNPHYIKNQIAALLLEVPGHKMPLFTFRELFASRYLTSVSVSDLYRMRDVCIIIEENNGRTITLNPEYRNTPSPALPSDAAGSVELPYCQRHGQQRGAADKGWAEQEQPSLANVRVRLAQLSQNVASLVQSHDNYLPLASLMDCYAAEFDALAVDEQSVPLEHLVTCISNVELVNFGGNKHLRMCATKPPLDTKNDDCIVKCVSPSLANHVSLFARELVDLLKMQPHCQLLFNRFIPAYHHHFGRQCRVADYGFTKLIDLLETLPHVVQVMGEGNKRVVTLSHRAQIRRFTSDLLRVLKSQPSKQVMVSELPLLFERTLGRPFDPVDYGLCYLDDLLTQLSANVVILSTTAGETSVAIPKREQTPEEMERTKQFALQVVELLSHTPQCSMEFAKFIPAYHHHYGTQCRVADFGFTKLIELFEAIPQVVKVEEEGEGVRKVTLTQPEKLKVLANQMSELVLPRYPPGLAMENVHSAYLWQFGYALKPSAYGCHDLTEVFSKLPTIKVVSNDDKTFLTPVDRSHARTLRLRVLRILWEHAGNRMDLAEFEQAFAKHYKEPCDRRALETDLQGAVKVVDDTIQLTPLEQFAHDVYELLCQSDGRLVLSQFETAFRRHFGAAPSAAQLGFPSTLSLLQAIDHVVTIGSRGLRKLITLNVELAAAGISVPPSLVRSGDPNDNTDYCNHSGNKGTTDFSNRQSSSQPLPKGALNRVSGNKPRQESPWNLLWTGKTFLSNNNNGPYNDNQDQGTVVNLPEPRTPPSKEECMALLSPAKFLLPANHAFFFLPSPPDPSELPRPNLTQVKNMVGNIEKHEDLDENEQAKRKLRLAASFRNPIQLK